MARLRFAGWFSSSGRRKLSVNRFLWENIKTGLEGPDKAKYQHQVGPNLSIEVGPDRSIELNGAPSIRKGCFAAGPAVWPAPRKPRRFGQYQVSEIGIKDFSMLLPLVTALKGSPVQLSELPPAID
jgi:hypothetical protein